jgi:uncharacterized protein YcsI (UPF0317 family)
MATTYRTPYELRLACRANTLAGQGWRQVQGFLCVNVVLLDKAYADDFSEFCARNPRPCPLIKRFEPGQTDCPELARDLDIRTDLASYDVLRDGTVETRTDITDLFTDRMVTFLIGSSTSFTKLLFDKGFRPHRIGPFGISTVQSTAVQCVPVGPFKGEMVVTVRAFDPDITDTVWEYTSHLSKVHGAPVGKNNWDELGIPKDVNWWGDALEVPPGTDRLYWGCGATPHVVATQAKLPMMISYTPGHALVTDVPTESLYE